MTRKFCKMLTVFGLGVLLLGCTHSLIVPQELPSILSLVYSNIPPIKKGTDSRLGFGFRLGEHADFQLMFELGPQTETRKIGGTSASKREIDPRQQPKVPSRKSTENLDAASWLTNWSNDMTQKKQKKTSSNAKKPSTTTSTTTSTTIRTIPLIPHSALMQLQQLYKQNSSEQVELQVKQSVDPSTTTTKRTVEEQKKITAELMDIDLE